MTQVCLTGELDTLRNMHIVKYNAAFKNCDYKYLTHCKKSELTKQLDPKFRRRKNDIKMHKYMPGTKNIICSNLCLYIL